MRHLLLASLLVPLAVAAQPARLAVTVVDTLDAPISGAAVRVLGRPEVAVTAADGLAELVLAAGLAAVTVAADGFEPATFTVTAAPGETLEGTVALAPATRVLGDVEAVADRIEPALLRRGFYERRAEGRGQYADREAFEARSLHTVRDAILGMSGVRIISWDERPVVVSSRSASGADGALQNAKPCPLSIFVDGHETQGETVDVSGIPTADLAGLEVYVGTARTPPEYGRFNPCGVILLWTRAQ
ncbi:carboxypeptidase-like regulatory domain-containing protein [Rubrivirga sp. IMCC43871]|uniref:carboxypeptidase-like regulatory domain-containing protein n=1 Tax=Rubrivirga sp. IMCC43871 TaxID=3391575 RepID=UPI0039900C1A